MKKIGLDAGHGLYTAGKQTPDGIKEWRLNDEGCDRIADLLKNYDCEIIRTDNNEGNKDESLSARIAAYENAEEFDTEAEFESINFINPEYENIYE